MARVSICLPPKRGHLKNGTNAVGRVHTHNHLLITSQYRYYQIGIQIKHNKDGYMRNYVSKYII